MRTRLSAWGSFSGDVFRIAVALVLLPAAAILALSLAMARLLPPPGSWVFPLFLLPLGAALVAGGVLLLLASREHARVMRNQALFLAQAGHELRTPLSVLELMAGELASSPGQGELAQRLAAAGSSLRAGIERLLDWGRLAAGSLRLRLEPVPVASVIEEAVQLVAPRLALRRQRLVRVGQGGGTVYGHRQSLVSALTNLLANASKYGPEASTVELGVGQETGWLKLWVRDQGPGISPAEQRKIFRAFYRGSGVTTEGVEGFGLGLAIVAQVAAAHRGKVTVTSRPGEGSSFTLWLRREPG